MTFSDRYPIIVTPAKNACRDFWHQHLGLAVAFDSQWFAYLTAEDGSASIGFMTPDHPSTPPGPEAFGGQGMCFELQVDDAQAAYAHIQSTGLAPSYPLTTEPWGQARFGFFDPSGLWIDVVQQVDPQAGYWDKYMV